MQSQKKFSQKVLSLFLALMLMLTVMPIAAFADGETYPCNAPNPITQNGVIASVTFSPNAQAATTGVTVTATVNFSGTAQVAATFSVNLTSPQMSVSGGTQTQDVAIGGTVSAKQFTFVLPERNVDLTLAFSSTPLTGVTLNKSSTSIVRGRSETLKATLIPVDTQNKIITWTSSDSSVATVNENGVVTAVYEGGTAITAISAANGKTATCIVTVTGRTSSSSSGSGDSGGSGGLGGAGSSTTNESDGILTSANVRTNGSVDSTKAVKELTAALKSAKKGTSATITIRNAKNIMSDTIERLAEASKTAGKSAVIYADSVGTDGKTQARIYLDVNKLANLKSTIKLRIATTGQKTTERKAYIEKNYSGKVAVVSCEHQGNFGAEMKISAYVKPPATKDLKFYSFDPKSKKLTEITTDYKINTDGSIQFTTKLGGDILIADKALVKKAATKTTTATKK